MDNQFSPTPPSTSGGQPPAQQTTTQEPTAVETTPPTTPTQLGPTKPKKSKKKWLVILLIVLLVAAVAGVYYWQQQEVKKLQDQNAALTTQLKSANDQIAQQNEAISKAKTAAGTATAAASSKTASTSDNIMTGAAAELAMTTATLNGSYKPGTVTAVWVEYGTEPTALSKATPKATEGLGAGDPKIPFVDQAFKVTGLTAGTRYVYRVAATENGKTVYGGVANFTSLK